MKYIAKIIALSVMSVFSLNVNAQVYTHKEVNVNDHGSYTISYESYVSGQKNSTTKIEPVEVALVFDMSESMLNKMDDNNSRIDNLKTAAKSFVEKLHQSYPQHEVALVAFTGSGTVKTKLAPIQNSKIITEIENLEPITGIISAVLSLSTRPDTGLETVRTNVFTNNSKNRKIVILFTDGVPNDGWVLNWDWSFSSSRAIKTINEAYKLKNDKGVDIYTICSLDEDDKTSDMINFLEYTSSDYPQAKGNSTWPLTSSEYGDKAASNYQCSVNNLDGLNKVFDDIFVKIEEGSASVQLTNPVITDIVSSSFKLENPDDINAVSVYEIPFEYNETNHSAAFNENNKTEWDDDTKAANIQIVNKTVTIKNFDFSANWCGPTINQSGTIVGAQGKKIRVEFDIVPDPNGVGGPQPTNAPGSGITDDSGNNYDFTTTPKYVAGTNLMDLVINVDGVAEGESIVINIKGGSISDAGINVMLTGDSNNKATGTIKVNAFGDNVSNPYVFSLSSADDWNWTYTISANADNPTTLYELNADETECFIHNEFNFTAQKNTSILVKNKEVSTQSNKFNK